MLGIEAEVDLGGRLSDRWNSSGTGVREDLEPDAIGGVAGGCGAMRAGANREFDSPRSTSDPGS